MIIRRKASQVAINSKCGVEVIEAMSRKRMLSL